MFPDVAAKRTILSVFKWSGTVAEQAFLSGRLMPLEDEVSGRQRGFV
jgi:hypothetical protein